MYTIYSDPNSETHQRNFKQTKKPTMADRALFRVRTEAAARIKLAMENYILAKDHVGGFKYNNAVTFVERIGDILKDEYFESAMDGMRGLLSDAPNATSTMADRKSVV